VRTWTFTTQSQLFRLGRRPDGDPFGRPHGEGRTIVTMWQRTTVMMAVVAADSAVLNSLLRSLEIVVICFTVCCNGSRLYGLWTNKIGCDRYESDLVESSKKSIPFDRTR
jgi:hypothetical protein